jgi:hypothetical protein
LNGDGNRLLRSLEVRCQESTVLDRKIAHDLTATHSEVVHDPYPLMVARKFRWEFYLIANMLPLFSHSSAFRRDVFQQRRCDEAYPPIVSPQARLIGARAVVKEIEVFGDFRFQ